MKPHSVLVFRAATSWNRLRHRPLHRSHAGDDAEKFSHHRIEIDPLTGAHRQGVVS